MADDIELPDRRPLFAAMYGFAKDHVALIAAAAGVILVAFRVLAVAEFQPSVAVAILSVGDPAKIALATVIGIVPVVAPIVAIAAGGAALFTDASVPLRSTYLGTALAAVILSLLATPANVLVGSLLAVYTIYQADLLLGDLSWDTGVIADERRRKRRMIAQTVQRAVLINSLFLALIMALPPFIPREVVGLVDGSQRVGLIVTPDDAFVVMLPDDTPTQGLVWLRRNDVASRAVCDPPFDPFTNTRPFHVVLFGGGPAQCPSVQR